MDSKSTEDKSNKSPEPPTASRVEPDPDLPVYYDSEPSSQPPQYHKASASASATAKLQSPPRPQANHTGSGASAATVAAVLASPSEHESKEKRSLRDRWKDWKERNSNHPDEYYANTGSTAQWNVLGASVKGYGREMRRGSQR